jgi:putative OPT family oligopeptide transporter
MALDHNTTDEKAFISADKNLPEITFKAVVLSIILVITLASANAYLGLKIGMTVSASIPAAVISMAVLSLFRNSNILENNIVQTAASAGEAIIAGISFVLPALIIIHFWTDFHYWETFWISIIGGVLGVLFTIPLRRVLLEHKALRFPEGLAIGNVLKARASGKGDMRHLISGSLIGSIISFSQAGLQIFSTHIQYWQNVATRFTYGFEIGFDPAVIAAGFIVGPSVAVSTLIGVLIGWVAGVPVLSGIYGVSAPDAATAAMNIWDSHIRYIGVGTMMVGGFWTLLTLIKPIAHGLRTSFRSAKKIGEQGVSTLRTERDIPIQYAVIATVGLCIPLAILLYHALSPTALPLSDTMRYVTVGVGVVFVLVAGFIFSALGGYFAGLFGSSNSPVSALSIAAILLISLIVLALWHGHIDLPAGSPHTLLAIAFVMVICSILSAANITNETIQDLKAGQMVGATPWKQEVMLILGTVISAFIVPWILQLLFNAYGIGGVFPRPNMSPGQMLAAPQAGMMAALAQGVFNANLPWNMVGVGGVIAVIAIIADHILRQRDLHLSVLALGFGIYLPLDATLPFVIGGLFAFVVDKSLQRRHPNDEVIVQERKHNGLSLACGIVAGASLMGVILAIPFAIKQSTDVLKIMPDNLSFLAGILGVFATVFLLGWIYYTTCVFRKKN